MWPGEVTLAFQVTAGNSRGGKGIHLLLSFAIFKTGTCYFGLKLLGLWVQPTVPDCNFHFLVVLGIK